MRLPSANSPRKTASAWLHARRNRRNDRTHGRPFRKAEGRGPAGAGDLRHGGDPDYETSLAILKALPAAGADVIELGMPFSDPMADGPAIQPAGLRALKAGQTLTKTLAHGARLSARPTTDTPIVLMGYYNPIYIYGVERFLDRRQGGRHRRADRRRPAAGNGRGTLPAGARGRHQLHPPRDADDRRQAPADGARRTPPASSTMSR